MKIKKAINQIREEIRAMEIATGFTEEKLVKCYLLAGAAAAAGEGEKNSKGSVSN